MRVKYHPDTEIELTEAIIFYETRIHGLGFRLLKEVERYTALVGKYPELGQVIDEDIRQLVFKNFPFSFIYTIETEYIWVLAFSHQRKKPGYWLDRL